MDSMDATPTPDDDRTARARIRDAAIARFADRGAARTSVKEVAANAGVSPALVFHHFGSKEGLREACDEHVVALVEQQKRKALSEGPNLDVLAALRAQDDGPPLLRYVARMVADGSPRAATLVDGMVDVTVASLEEGVRSGVMVPTDEPRDLSVVLALWSLGLLVLQDHAERLLGVDITGAPEDRGRYVRVAMLALRGLFTEEAFEHAQRMLRDSTDEKERADE